MNGNINIEVFDILDKIAYDHRITSAEWAKSSGVPAARISELRNRAKGRAFSAERMFQLLSGLTCIIGVEAVKKALKEKIDRAKTQEEQNYLLVALLNSDKQDVPRVNAILKAFLQDK